MKPELRSEMPGRENPKRSAVVRRKTRVSGSIGGRITEVLVRGIEFRCAHDQYLHFSDRSMLDPGRNEDGHQRPNRMQFAIQFDRGISITAQNHVDLGVIAVVMRFGIQTDLRQVQRAGELG